MYYRLAADSILILHFSFIVFVVLGGLLALRYKSVSIVHIPAACWGAFIELSGRVCPLTTLENSLRQSAGELSYAESFIEHYLLPIIYPMGLTQYTQWWLAGFIVLINSVIYGLLLYRWRRPLTHKP